MTINSPCFLFVAPASAAGFDPAFESRQPAWLRHATTQGGKMRLPGSKCLQAVIITAAFLAFPWAALPQTATTGSITGLVKDGTGAVVPSARATAKNEATN